MYAPLICLSAVKPGRPPPAKPVEEYVCVLAVCRTPSPIVGLWEGE
jgi:hypothetical protein